MDKLELFAQTIYDLDKFIQEKENEANLLEQERKQKEPFRKGMTLQECQVMTQLVHLRAAMRTIQNCFDNERKLLDDASNKMVKEETKEEFEEHLKLVNSLLVGKYDEERFVNENKTVPTKEQTIAAIQARSLLRAISIVHNSANKEVSFAENQ